MVVKVYVSGISGNKEVKKRQQRVLMILDSKNIKYDIIDITEPGRESDKDFMQSNSKSNGGTVSDPNPRSPLPPQVFNDEEYCGDYDQFDLANEMDILEQFLKVEVPPETAIQETALNGDLVSKGSKENSQEPKPTERSDEKEKSPAKEDDSVIEKASSKDVTPPLDETTQDDSTPTDESKPENESQETNEKGEDTNEKESSPVKETEVKTKLASEDSSPPKEEAVIENGTVSSREQSQGRDVEEVVDKKKDDPSEALIESEKVAASE